MCNYPDVMRIIYNASFTSIDFWETAVSLLKYKIVKAVKALFCVNWSNSIYDRGCVRAISDHVMKVTDRESAKIPNRIQSVTTVIG